MTEAEIIRKMIQLIASIAIDCSDHLKNQHSQGENSKPRFYFDNIVKQAQDLLAEVE